MVENMTVKKAEHLARILERALDIAFEMIDPDGNFANCTECIFDPNGANSCKPDSGSGRN